MAQHERVRASNPRDQQLEREGIESEHNRSNDEAAKGRSEPADRVQPDAERAGSNDVDPDSAASDIDRDDTMAD